MADDEKPQIRRSGRILLNDWDAVEGHRMQIHFRPIPPEYAALIAENPSPSPLDGALLALQLWADDATYTWGSAALIAPGIALAARHVVDAMVAKREEVGGESQIFAIGIGADELDIWHVRDIRCSTQSDVAIMTMDMGKEDYSNLEFNVFQLSARMPAVGEPVLMIGFVAAEESFPISPDEGDAVETYGTHMVSLGEVRVVYAQGRDKTRLPHPCIEVGVNVFGGMSGGPAFDKDGNLIGLISSSIHSDDGSGPAWVSLLLNPLTFEINASWPPNLFPKEPFKLNDLAWLNIKDKWRLIVEGDGTLRYDGKPDQS